MALKAKSTGEWLLLLTAVIVVGGFAFWHSDLSSDPPMYFSGIGQSMSTDPYMYSFHARNKILYGDFNPLDDPRWVVFEKSLVSLSSYIWLSITEITIKEANTVGVLLSVAGLFLILLGLPRFHHPWVTCAVAACYLANVCLLTYGRLPYLENGLIFWSGVLFLVWARWGDRNWGVAVAGAVIALATVTGKVFGVLLLPALALTLCVSGRSDLRRHLLILTAAFGSAILLLLGVLYNGQSAQAFGFVSFQSVGLHGFPDGLTSPWAFLEHLVSFGESTSLYYLSPDILLFLFAGGLLLISHRSRSMLGLRELPPTVSFSMFWLLCGWIGLMPLNYSPLRYSLFLIPAAILFCFTLIDHLIRSRREAVAALKNRWLPVAALLFWMAVYHGIIIVFFYNNPDAPRRTILWSSAVVGLLAALGFKYMVEKRLRLYSRPLLISVAVGLIAISIVANGARVRRKHFLEHNFSVAETNQDLSRILGGNAVITGPYAPTITFQTNYQSLIHFFGAARKDSTLFDTYPITHVALDISNRRQAEEDFPALADLQPVARYWIRDIEIELINVSKLFSNDRANAYVDSPYELAVSYYRQNMIDSALAALSASPNIMTDSKAAGLLYSRLMYHKKQYQHVLSTLVALADRFPTDFSLQLECGHFLERLALEREDRALLMKAQRYFERAAQLNPYKAAYANKLFGETLQQWNNSQNGSK